MLPALSAQPLVIAGVLFGALGGVLMVTGLLALRRRRPLRFAVRSLLGLLLLSLGALSASIAIGMQGYRALTREDLAARVEVRPLGDQRFGATFHIPGRAESTYYELAGDALYVDAHILKWRPVVNVLGLHTAYELDRVSGRYDDLEQERAASRTVHTLGPERRVDLFALRTRYAFLAPLLDAEYGSGAFVRVTGPADFDVLVSTTGLLMRPRASAVP